MKHKGKFMKMMRIMINEINFNNLSRSKDLKINKKA